jgi:hypothetical protein
VKLTRTNWSDYEPYEDVMSLHTPPTGALPSPSQPGSLAASRSTATPEALARNPFVMAGLMVRAMVDERRAAQERRRPPRRTLTGWRSPSLLAPRPTLLPLRYPRLSSLRPCRFAGCGRSISPGSERVGWMLGVQDRHVPLGSLGLPVPGPPASSPFEREPVRR